MHTKRSFALFGFLLMTILFAIATKAEAADAVTLKSMAATALVVKRADGTYAVPERPLSSFVVTECSEFVSVWLTWKDGHVTLIDSKSPDRIDDMDALKALVLAAPHNKVLEMACRTATRL